MTASTVLFWDIDGTLLTTARAGIAAWEQALGETAGHAVSLQDVHTAGLTDVEIARMLLRSAGREPGPEAIHSVLRRYEQLLPDALPLRQGRVLPGVREVLEDLAGRPTVMSLLLTGNTAAAAAVKLTYYGLASFFDGGAFAEDGEDRPGVARRALEIATARLGARRAGRVFVIGDTPADILCGRAIGAKTIAVASGPYSAPQLSAYDPWWLIPALPAPQTFLAKVGASA